jgi:hypothetical protein
MNAKERDPVKQLFDAVAEKRVDVERVFGGPLTWERLDEKTASRVAIYREGRITVAPDELENVCEWAATRWCSCMVRYMFPQIELLPSANAKPKRNCGMSQASSTVSSTGGLRT